MKSRDRIGMVLYASYIVMLIASVLVIGKILWLQIFFKPDPEIADVIAPRAVPSKIEPIRGDILDCEGRLLAMSYPVYSIFMDCTVLKSEHEQERDLRLKKAQTPEQRDSARIIYERKENEWKRKASALSRRLPEFFPSKTAAEYERLILQGRENGKKYVRIGGPVDWKVCAQLQGLPLFKEGRFHSGLIVKQDYIRKYPYGKLARRTIGFIRGRDIAVENSHIGLEGKFDEILHGKNGTVYLRKTDHGMMRDNDSSMVKPVDGKDLRTTINIDYQEILDKALREQIEPLTDLEGACAVLMETQTGAIRAMVNLVRDPSTGRYEESQNYAVGRKFEPGSVFKTVILASALNDNLVRSIEETMPATNGKVPGTNITDDHIPQFARTHKTDVISIKDGLSISSNYVFAKLAVDCYGSDPSRLVKNLDSFKFSQALDFDLDGVAQPFISSPENRKPFTNNDLGRMGFGYNVQVTPLQILCFYNAIANKGRMMKPYLVEDFESGGTVSDRRGPSVLSPSICSRQVADTLMRALRAVTEDGTARRSLKGVKCPVAGKTGTSYGSFDAGGYKGPGGKIKYQGSFVCFFPADSLKGPRYSMICTLFSKPTHNQYQGGGIPARVTATVVDRLYAIDPWFRPQISKAR